MLLRYSVHFGFTLVNCLFNDWTFPQTMGENLPRSVLMLPAKKITGTTACHNPVVLHLTNPPW
jgi:hypothetical protein